MINRVNDVSLANAAIISGLGLLLMTISFLVADLLIFQKVIIPEDAVTTAKNIMSHGLLFRTGICAFLVVIVCDIIVAWALYVLLKPVNKSLSLLTAWFRLVYSTIFAVALVNYLEVFQLLTGSEYVTVFEPAQLNAQVMLSINAFSEGWAIGFIFFGLHLTLLGYLAFRSDYIPKTLGILLTIAGVGYLIDYFAKFLFPDANVMTSMIVGWGELLFMFWLLIKGKQIRELKENT